MYGNDVVDPEEALNASETPEFDEVMAQVERWGLDQYLRDRSYDHLSYSAGT